MSLSRDRGVFTWGDTGGGARRSLSRARGAFTGGGARSLSRDRGVFKLGEKAKEKP